ncbi:glutamate-5-semialdehyde dehydrogenase [Acidisphaera sp. L21]|uniref:glutamate-5-semialdehyde dehydrogenase n=1 Tax=Acidisphaera sp. L21 TaxID=1641851 RepID=UPI00131DFC70|nr:glutamate-5-semialdehyde dehydrogenase [Acidisphaera sp. L21]
MTADTDRASQWLHSAGATARAASATMARSPAGARNAALLAAAAALRANATAILGANEQDLIASKATAAFRDRLTLTPDRVEAMAVGLEEIAALPDPLARTLAEWSRPNGLQFRRIATPIGVIGMIYESRPNVGADAAGLCLKSGNAVLLRGGSESLHSARAIHAAMTAGLAAAGLPEAAVQIAPEADRAYVAAMLAGSGLVDLIIPRGGKSLVERVQREARIPVLAHAEGLNHLFVHAAADASMACSLLVNSKLRRPGVCGATETLLVDSAAPPSLLPQLIQAVTAFGCAIRADARTRAILPELPAADPSDFDTEWQDAILNVAMVDGIDGALSHIARHGSEHTDAIVTADAAVAETFLAGVSSAVALWNASTQFCDGGEFGFGAEIGIATGRMHARGPIGLEQLTSFRYVVTGTGQVRP